MLYRANFISTKGTLLVVNTLHIRTANTDWAQPFDSANPTPQALADEMHTQFSTLYRAMLQTTYTLERIAVTSVPDPNDPSQVPTAGEHAVALAGTRSAGNVHLPDQMCGLLSLRTAFAGRSFRGRMFLPPLESATDLTNNLIDVGSTYTTAVNAWKAKLDDSFGGGGTFSSLWNSTWSARVVVYSPTRHRANADPISADLTSVRYDRSAHWLRSRAK